MGANKVGRNEPCNCGSGKKYKVCCYLTEYNKKITKGLNYISPDSYFIRLTTDRNQYVHLEDESKENYTYMIKGGTAGACLWHKEQGETFIKNSGYTNMELIQALKVLGNDGTLN